jgi:two-component system C4-dicarboxylate transport response regulator DctD
MHTVLLIEDDKSTRDAVSALLEFNGFLVEAAADANVALRLLSSAKFDVVISDVWMPGNGHTVLHHVRTWWPDVPVIILTAAQSAPPGAFVCLRKPAVPRDLVDAIHRAIKSTPRQATTAALLSRP